MMKKVIHSFFSFFLEKCLNEMDLVASMMEDYLRENCPKNVLIKKELPEKEKRSSFGDRPLFGRGRGKQEMNRLMNSNSFSRRLPANEEDRFVFSQRLHSLRRSPIDDELNYSYRKSFSNEQLSYLHGPGKERIVERNSKDILPYLSLGYCRVKTSEQGKDIEQFLHEILPKDLTVQPLNMKKDFSLIVCSSAAQKLFEESNSLVFPHSKSFV